MTVGQAPAAPGRIFISYRREETAYPAGWLFDRLADHFGEAQIFKDIDSIEPGDDFVETITNAVGSCEVLLALIGDQWITIADAAGNRRLDDPSDFLRLEIEAALARDVRVIPILVEGARMPRADELPESMATLVRRQALELSPSHFAADLARLLKVLDRTLTERQPPAATTAAVATAVPATAAERSSDPPAATAGPRETSVPPPTTTSPVPSAMATWRPPPSLPDPRRGSDTPAPIDALEVPARARRPLPKPARVAMVVVTLMVTLVLVVALSMGESPPSSSDGDETPTEEEAPSEEAPPEEAPADEAPPEEPPP